MKSFGNNTFKFRNPSFFFFYHYQVYFINEMKYHWHHVRDVCQIVNHHVRDVCQIVNHHVSDNGYNYFAVYISSIYLSFLTFF